MLVFLFVGPMVLYTIMSILTGSGSIMEPLMISMHLPVISAMAILNMHWAIMAPPTTLILKTPLPWEMYISEGQQRQQVEAIH